MAIPDCILLEVIRSGLKLPSQRTTFLQDTINNSTSAWSLLELNNENEHLFLFPSLLLYLSFFFLHT